MSEIKSVLFVCTGNSCRSVMAHYLAEKLAADAGREVSIASAGTMPGGGLAASPETVELLAKDGIDASSHISSELSEELLLKYDVICVMTKGHANIIEKQFPMFAGKVRLLSDYYEGEDKPLLTDGVPDPIGMGIGFYERVYNIVKMSLKKMMDLK